MIVGREHFGDAAVVIVTGLVDVASAAMLYATLPGAAGPAGPLVVDVSGAEVGDVAGLALVVNAVRRLAARPDRPVVVCGPGAVRSALERTGVAGAVAIVETRDAAPGALDAAPGPDAGAAEPSPRRQRGSTPWQRGALLADATLEIEGAYGDADLGLGDVAHRIATSPRQLQRVFAELAGTTFRDELSAVRMQHAAELLQATSLPVTEIAGRVGHRQSAQFAKAFRRHHGVPPTAFRRAAREAAYRAGPPSRPAPDAGARRSDR